MVRNTLATIHKSWAVPDCYSGDSSMSKTNTGTAQDLRSPPSEDPLLALPSTQKYTLNKKPQKGRHLKQRIERNSLNCSVRIWVLPHSDSSWSASPQKHTDLEQVLYSLQIFTVVGTSDFTRMFQHTRPRFSLCTYSSFHICTTAWVSFSSFIMSFQV